MNPLRIIPLLLLLALPCHAVVGTNTINLGAAPNDGTGDSIRVAFSKVNAALYELSTNVSIITTNGIVAGALRSFPTIADMVAANPILGTNATVMVGGEFYIFDPSSTATTNQITWASTYPGYESAGRWVKSNQQNQLVIDTSGFITNANVITVATKADLQNVDTSKGYQLAKVRGKYNISDGWEGDFIWNAASTYVADDAFHVAPNSGSGTWDRSAPNPLTQIPATWFDPGLTNGVIQAALDYAAALNTNAVTGREVLLPPTFISVNGNTGLAMHNGVNLVGQPGTVLSASTDTTNGYRMIYFNGVTNSAMKNLRLTGFASASGYGIFETNSSYCLWGGITFDTNFTAGAVWITNSSLTSVFDDRWNRNSLRGYGAQGNNINDDTIPMQLALANTAPQTGDEITLPPGTYAMNVVGSNVFGVSVVGIGAPGSGVTNAFITAFNPTNAAMRFGDSSASSINTRSLRISKVCFDYRGPTYSSGSTNTYGQIGLAFGGGVYETVLDQVTIQGHAYHGLELIGGTNQPVSVLSGTVNLYGSDGTATASTRQLYARYRLGSSGYVTDVRLEGKFGGCTNGYLIESDGVSMDLAGYADITGGHGILNSRTDTGGPFHHILGKKLVLDVHGGNAWAIENTASAALYPWSCIGGEVETSSNVKHSDGQSYPIYNNIPVGGNATNFNYFGYMYGPMVWNLPGTFSPLPNNYLYNDASSNLIGQTTNSFIFTHVDGGKFRVKAYTNNANIELQDSTGTATINHAGNLFRFIPAASDELRLDNGSANRVFSLTSSAHSDSIRITSTGVGVNQVSPGLSFQIDSLPTVAGTQRWGAALNDTNTTGSTAMAAFQMIAAPNTTTPGADNPQSSALYAQGGTAAVTNDFYGSPGIATIRAGTVHRGSGKVQEMASLVIDGSSSTGGGVITNQYGIKISAQSSGINNWGLYQVGATTSNKFEGQLSYGAEGGTAVSAVGKDANGVLTTTGVPLITANSATAVAGRDAGNNITTAATTGLVPTFAGENLNGTLGINVGTLTVDGANALLTSRYNNGSTVFTGVLKLSLTDSAHAAGSQFIRAQVNSADVYTLDPSGNDIIAGTHTIGGSSGPTWSSGTGAPSADAPIGSFYSRTDGGVGSTFYVKEVAGAGAGNWKAK